MEVVKKKYLGGNLNASLQEDKQVIDDVKETLAKTTVDEEIEKLKEQMDSAQSFYNFQQEFHEDYQHLQKNLNKHSFTNSIILIIIITY